MQQTRFLIGVAVLCLTAVADHPVAAIEPVGTTFTYQGQLKQDSQPVHCTADSGCGGCEFLFKLFDAESDGSEACPTGISTCPEHKTVDVVNGLFKVSLDFGGTAFTGERRWLQVDVRCPGDTDYLPLEPRQQVTPAPYALHLPHGTIPVVNVNDFGAMGDCDCSDGCHDTEAVRRAAEDCPCSDLNGDDTVDLNDYVIFEGLLGSSSTKLPPNCP